MEKIQIAPASVYFHILFKKERKTYEVYIFDHQFLDESSELRIVKTEIKYSIQIRSKSNPAETEEN